MAMSDADARKLYRRWMHELWRTGARELAGQLVTPDFVGHWPGREVSGPDGLAEAIGQALALFTEVTTAIEVGPIVDGDLVAARWRFEGAYRGGMPGATAPVGTPATLRGADVLRIADRRFAEYWVSSDQEQLVAQLSGGA
jgi:hypothetical protein